MTADRLARLTAQYGSRMAEDIISTSDKLGPYMTKAPERWDAAAADRILIKFRGEVEVATYRAVTDLQKLGGAVGRR